MTNKTWKIIATILFILFIIVPGSTATPFNGIPLNNYELFFVFSIITALWTTPWSTKRRIRIAVTTSIALLVILQFVGFLAIPYGWSVCLKGELAKKPVVTACEPTAEVRNGERSYLYPHIDFTNDSIPLHFMNNRDSFGYYGKDQPDRATLPYTFIASTFLQPKNESVISVITSITNTTIRINNKTHTIPINQTTSYNLTPRTVNEIAISYTVEKDKNTVLSATTNTNPFYTLTNENITPNTWLRIYRFLFAFTLLVLSIPLLGQVLTTINNTSKKTRVLIITLLLLLGATTIIKPFPYLIQTISIIAISWFFISRKKAEQKKLYFVLIIFLLIASSIMISKRFPYPLTVLYDAGRDPLTHESQSRDILTARSFTELIGERAFYYQPMYRYQLGTLHKLFGDALWGPFVIQTLIASLLFYITLRFLTQVVSISSGVIFSILTLLLYSFNYISLFYLSRTPFQQSLATPELLIGILLILFTLVKHTFTWKMHLAIGLLIGASIATRTDNLPILLPLFIYTTYIMYAMRSQSYKARIAIAVALAIGVIIFPSLMITKNYLAAGVMTLTPTSANINQFHEFNSVSPHQPKGTSGLTILLSIIKAYEGNYPNMIVGMYHNLHINFIGEIVQRQFIWMSAVFITLLGIVKSRDTHRIVLLFTCITFLSLLIPNLFFRLHIDSYEMHILYDYMLIIILSISAGVLLKHNNSSKKHT